MLQSSACHPQAGQGLCSCGSGATGGEHGCACGSRRPACAGSRLSQRLRRFTLPAAPMHACSHVDARCHVHPPWALPAAAGRVQHCGGHVHLSTKARGGALPRGCLRRCWHLRHSCASLLLADWVAGVWLHLAVAQITPDGCRVLPAPSRRPTHLPSPCAGAATAGAPAANVSAIGFPYPYLDPECWGSGACYPAYDAAGTVSTREDELRAQRRLQA